MIMAPDINEDYRLGASLVWAGKLRIIVNNLGGAAVQEHIKKHGKWARGGGGGGGGGEDTGGIELSTLYFRFPPLQLCIYITPNIASALSSPASRIFHLRSKN